MALDVSVEEGDLKVQEAQIGLAKTILDRCQNLSQELATTQEEADRARTDLDVAQAQIGRAKAIIARKRSEPRSALASAVQISTPDSTWMRGRS